MSEPLYIVIPDFNGWQQTEVCLRRLQQSAYTNFRAIVVDHGTDGKTAAGLHAFPFCIPVRGDPDQWWSGATNLGIREALQRGARQVMLLNNDCFVTEATLASLLGHQREDAVRLVAPVQRDAETGEVLVARAGTCFTLGFPTLVTPGMRRVPAQGSELLSTRLIVGGRGVVIPAAVFDTVGLFDEQALPHYGADHDFFLRCRDKGIPLFVAADASVHIDNTRTTAARNLGELSWRQFRSTLGDIRSHRNIAALRTLFKRYYPVRLLYPVGVFLNLGRYVLDYLAQKAWYALRRPGE